MAWTLDADRPIYAQLVERIQMEIVSGRYSPGSRLPSVRELAAEAAVNPNTMQKAFAELERNGLVITQRTNGRSVTEDMELISGLRRELVRRDMQELLGRMKALGYTRQEITELMYQELDASEGEVPGS